MPGRLPTGLSLLVTGQKGPEPTSDWPERSYLHHGGTRQPCTNTEIKLAAVVAFKNKVDMKAYNPFKDKARWIQWWSGFKITLGCQGMEAVLDTGYVPREADEALGFIRMQNMAFANLLEQIQTPAAKSIL